jgi:L-ascorbate metabolism protein UlaG (beta-lactamase superfamily)
MKKYPLCTPFIFVLALLITVGCSLDAQKSRDVTFTFYGQACFMITTSQGTRIVTDPMKLDGYPLPKDLAAEIVTVSHNHRDHNYVEAVTGKPRIIYGIQDKAGEALQDTFNNVDEKIKDVRIFNVLSNHFNPKVNSTINAIFVFEFDGIRVIHLGDIGTVLSTEQLKKIGYVDVLMIPVGGKYTVSLPDADAIISQLKPKMVIFPMHFKTDAADFLPTTAEDFLKGKSNVERISNNSYTLNLVTEHPVMKYILLNYKKR